MTEQPKPSPPLQPLPSVGIRDGEMLPQVSAALLAAIDDGPQAVALFDPADNLAYGNQGYRQAWSVGDDAHPSFASIMRACHAKHTGALIATDDIEAWIATADRRRRAGPAFRAFEVDLCDGRWFWITERRLDQGWILLIGQDITALKHNEQTLRAARDAAVVVSLTDPLTRLANRRSAMDQLHLLLASQQRFYLALVDIDHFKRINDSFGHATGDAVLTHVARQLERLRNAGCAVARLAGDEFAVIGPAGCDRARFERLLRDMMAALGTPLDVDGRIIRVELSIGVARSHEDGGSAGELMAAADAAMYETKRSGRSDLRFHEAWMGHARHVQAELGRDLPLAIRNNELVPFYQPIVDLRTGLVRGLEALVRWNHPTRGRLAPAAFAPAFDDPNLAVAIDDFMLEAALSQMGEWVEQGVPVAAVNVNASDAQLHRPDLVARIETLLRRNRLTPDRLKVEVVETAFLGQDAAQVAKAINELAELGVVCALDDFGTGYASLSHLRQFRIGRIKIDRTFVANICSDSFDLGLVRGMIDLGRNLGIRITAEGVETPVQLRLLHDLGCACAQGYFIGEPTGAGDVPAMIAKWYAKFASFQGRAEVGRPSGSGGVHDAAGRFP